MSNKFFNFYYDPVRQGYDTNTWSTLLGVPAIVSNKLQLVNAGAIHFADLLRGEAIFNVTMPEPANTHDMAFGFIEYNKNAWARFRINDENVIAEISNGGTDDFELCAWNSDWNDAPVEFKIKWEAGMVTFSIGGEMKWQTTDRINIEGDPMSLYVYNNTAAAVPMDVSYIIAKGVQSSTLKVF
ncbi:MAG: hypothetical protein WC069_05995 [Candidatus Shapirobacteria bacterium]